MYIIITYFFPFEKYIAIQSFEYIVIHQRQIKCNFSFFSSLSRVMKTVINECHAQWIYSIFTARKKTAKKCIWDTFTNYMIYIFLQEVLQKLLLHWNYMLMIWSGLIDPCMQIWGKKKHKNKFYFHSLLDNAPNYLVGCIIQKR